MADEFPQLYTIDPASPSAGAPALSDPARALVLETAAEIRSDWSHAADVLNRALRTHKGLASRERRLVSETVHGLIRFDRRLDAMLDEIQRAHRGLTRTLTSNSRDRVKLLLFQAAAGARLEAVATALRAELGFVPPARQVTAPDAGLGKRSGLDREAVRLSFPTWLVETLSSELGEAEVMPLLSALNQRAPLNVLVNVDRIRPDALLARLAGEGVEATPCRLARFGLTLHTRVNVQALPSFQEGLFDVMDEGSQLVAEVADAQPGLRVVDACAGAGGKTLAMEQVMQGKGRILALDVSGKKLEEARRRVRRAGWANVTAVEVQGGVLPDAARAEAWDRVLVDAPCSSLGSMRRAPELRWRLKPADVTAFSNQQLGILSSYATLVAPGGRLVYATCTLVRDENEGVIERFLADRHEFRRVPLAEVVGSERAAALGDGLSLRVFPHRQGCDGFFASVLERAP